MSKYKAGMIGALMLVLTGTSAGAADFEDYRGSLKDDGYYDMPVENSGWYVRGDFGYGFNSDPTITDDQASFFVGESLDDNVSFGGGIGYNIMRGFRVDLTLDYRADADLYAYYPASPASPLTGELSSWVGLANFYYDFDMGHRITPYVGVGLGFAAHTMDAGKNIGAGDFTDFSGKTETEFAWALMAGVDIDLRSNWKLDIGYRYLDLGDVSYTDATSGTKTFIIDDLESHEIRVGLRYQFGCLRDCGPSYEPMK